VAEPVHLELSDGKSLVSSTLIRRLVSQGRVADAALCLGRPFALYGRVVRGRGIGRLLDYPTANLRLGDQVIPADGVYAGYADLAGKRCAAAISVGSAPTFCPESRGQRTVEAFLLNGSGDLYDLDIELSFTHRLREQRRYDSPEALKAQMAKDVEQVRQLCK
jgi:riboflavin kinase/FMN adenylyltransferase